MRFSRYFRCLAILLGFIPIGSPVHGYNLFGPYPWGDDGTTYYNKWGDIFTPGSPGDTITWQHHARRNDSSTRRLTIPTSAASRGPERDHERSVTSKPGAIEPSLAQWSAAANIYFVQVPYCAISRRDCDYLNTGIFACAPFPSTPASACGLQAPPPNG